MNKGKKMRKTLLIAIIIMVFTLGYALLSADLDIMGIYGVRTMKWDVVFENPVLSQNSVGSVPTITNKTTLNYSFTFDEPEDFYEFTVDAKNNGTIDAIVASVENDISNVDESVYDFLEYEVTNVTTNSKIHPGQVLNRRTTNTYKVRVSLKQNLSESELPSVNYAIDFTFKVNFEQKKKGVEEKYDIYNGKASSDEVIYQLYNYEVTSENDKTAKITGFNEYYKVEDENEEYSEHPEAFIRYCYYGNSDYCNLGSSDYIANDIQRLVIPSKVKLIDEKYSSAGEEYTITNVDISNAHDYYINNGIQEMIFPNTVTTLNIADYESEAYKYLENIVLPDNLTSLPYFNFSYDDDEYVYHTPQEFKIPRTVTNLETPVSGYFNFVVSDSYGSYRNYCEYDDDDNYVDFGESEYGITLYIPKEVTSISYEDIIFSNIKKFYVENKTVKNRLESAIDGYCENRYDYYNDCYSDSNSCKSKIKRRIEVAPTKFY